MHQKTKSQYHKTKSSLKSFEIITLVHCYLLCNITTVPRETPQNFSPFSLIFFCVDFICNMIKVYQPNMTRDRLLCQNKSFQRDDVCL